MYMINRDINVKIKSWMYLKFVRNVLISQLLASTKLDEKTSTINFLITSYIIISGVLNVAK